MAAGHDGGAKAHYDSIRVFSETDFTVTAWDVNCPQHIHRRFGERQMAPVIEKLETRSPELEAEVERLKATPPTNP